MRAIIDTLLKLVLPNYIKHPLLWSIRPLLFKLPPISLIAFPCYFCNCKLIHLKNCFTTLRIMQNCEYLVACVFLGSRLIHNISLSLNLSLASFWATPLFKVLINALILPQTKFCLSMLCLLRIFFHLNNYFSPTLMSSLLMFPHGLLLYPFYSTNESSLYSSNLSIPHALCASSITCHTPCPR